MNAIRTRVGSSRKNRSGHVDFLAAIAIVGVIVGLLLPLAQVVREYLYGPPTKPPTISPEDLVWGFLYLFAAVVVVIFVCVSENFSKMVHLSMNKWEKRKSWFGFTKGARDRALILSFGLCVPAYCSYLLGIRLEESVLSVLLFLPIAGAYFLPAIWPNLSRTASALVYSSVLIAGVFWFNRFILNASADLTIVSGWIPIKAAWISVALMCLPVLIMVHKRVKRLEYHAEAYGSALDIFHPERMSFWGSRTACDHCGQKFPEPIPMGGSALYYLKKLENKKQ